MPRKLIIISDLWGWNNSHLPKYISDALSPRYDVELIDAKELADIDNQLESEVQIHQAFVHGGIDRAVLNLKASQLSPVDILSFSIGGVIGWKAALTGMSVDKLVAVSSTRLRYETKEPDCAITLHYGSEDRYKPSSAWFDFHNTSYMIHNGYSHDFYNNHKMLDKVLQGFNDGL